MNKHKLFTALLLMFPGLSWGNVIETPEPGILPLLAAGGLVAGALAFIRRNK